MSEDPGTDHRAVEPVLVPVRQPKPRASGRRLRVAGLALLVLGAAGIGAWGGWTVRDRVDDEPVPAAIDVSVDRPVLVLDAPTDVAGAMPSVVGLSVEQARQALSDAGIDIAGVSEVVTPFAGPGGMVVAQDPRGSTPAPDAVTLTLSQPTAVPEMVGARIEDARDVLTDLGVRIDITTEYVAGQPEGAVLASDPGPGEPLPTELHLRVAEAASSVFLADLPAITSQCSIGDATVNASDQSASLVCSPAYDQPEVAEYVLNRQIENFEATIGIDDRSEVGVPIRFRVLVDDQVAFDATVTYGTSQEITIPVSAALRVTLETARTGADLEDCCDTAAVWGGARLTGGLDAVTRLFEESNP
jgi:NPCBM/NEW2 domain-containing protein/PASTA domain-containing protein